jgi:hypothetical protein
MSEITEHVVRAQAKYLAERAKKIILETGDVTPIVVVVCRENPTNGEPLSAESCLVPIVPAAHHESPSFSVLNKIQTIALAGDALASILCATTWGIVERPARDHVVEYSSNDIATSELRQEVLTVSIEWNTGRVDSSVWLIERDQGFVDFVELPGRGQIVDVGGTIGNTFATRNRKTPPEIMIAAREVSLDILKEIGVAITAAFASRGPVGRG